MSRMKCSGKFNVFCAKFDFISRKERNVLNSGLHVNVKAASSIINCEPYCNRTYSNFDTEKILKREIIRKDLHPTHIAILHPYNHYNKISNNTNKLDFHKAHKTSNTKSSIERIIQNLT